MRSTIVGRTFGGVILLLAATIHVQADAATPYSEWGYLTMDDGVELRYDVVRPTKEGRYPVAVVYSPYSDGTDPIAYGNDPELATELLNEGFAIVGVNERGTGCSSGYFDPFEPRAASDGAAVIEWAAGQRWSSGHVGMFGLSAPGILQFGPAAKHPPHLDAIAPFQVATDLYRDVVYPGGIYNVGFAAFWSLADQPSSSDEAAAGALEVGDTTCAQHIAGYQAANLQYNAFPNTRAHPFDDGWYAYRDPKAWVRDVEVPVLECVTWQDGSAGSRGGYTHLDELDPAKTWIMASNGYHGMCNDPFFGAYLVRFFDHFVKQVDNGFEATPHVTVLHDTHVVGSGPVLPLNFLSHLSADVLAPSWTTTHPAWPVEVRAVALHLRSGGLLGSDPPSGPEAADSYLYPLPAPSNEEDGPLLGEPNLGWKAPFTPGGSVSFTTPALDRDSEIFGTGSANLWLTSTAEDTDLQLTLSEVRPDGREVYVERGWLRASHRKLDPVRSTELRPYQTHQASDVEPLVRGEPTLVRVEIFPFDYVFRAGSSIRLTVEAPTGVTGFWAFDFLKTPAINSILHDGSHDSQLVLGLVPGGRAEQPLPPCDSLLNQPCRPNLVPVPQGEMETKGVLAGRLVE